jgi:hypothetical protein
VSLLADDLLLENGGDQGLKDPVAAADAQALVAAGDVVEQRRAMGIGRQVRGAGIVRAEQGGESLEQPHGTRTPRSRRNLRRRHDLLRSRNLGRSRRLPSNGDADRRRAVRGQ